MYFCIFQLPSGVVFEEEVNKYRIGDFVYVTDRFVRLSMLNRAKSAYIENSGIGTSNKWQCYDHSYWHIMYKTWLNI